MAEEKNTAQSGAAPPAPPAPDPATRITELEKQLASKTEELSKAGTRLAELEKAAIDAGKRADLLDGGLKKAVGGYKSLIIQANPGILPELISGETIEALDTSLEKAKELTAKVKAGLEAQIAAARIPAGAPLRGAADVSTLSSREKINLGVEKARKL